MRLLAVDVDLCTCPSDAGWLQWLRYHSQKGQQHFPQGKFPYNLAEMFPDVDDPMDYWRNLDYFQFLPIEGSAEALEKLSQYFGIVFVSRTKGVHSKSKYYWLKSYFPFLTEYVVMHKKGILNDAFVAMIDDRLDVLKGFDYNKRILFETNYEQSVECDVAIRFNVWDNKIVEQICDRYL